MQDSYNNASYPQIPTDESLIIPECVNWNMINSVGPIPTNYRERLLTDNNDNTNNSYNDDSNVPRPQIYIQKRHQIELKLDIDNVSSINYDSDDSGDETSLVNVPKTIKIMDILYNTNFSSQLRSEQNISTISHYLKNIINKTDDRRKNEVYSVKKIVNVLNWIFHDWQIESIVKVIVNITSSWTLDKSKKDDSRLGRLVRKITVNWDPQYVAHLVSILFATHPLCNQNNDSCKEYKEVFLKVLSKRWKFCRLSQFFICLGNKGAINHKLKMQLLQRSAKFEEASKKTNFKFSNESTTQKKVPVVVSTPQLPSHGPFSSRQPSYQSQTQHQPQSQPLVPSQIQFQPRPQSQSVDNIVQQMPIRQNQSGQSPQIYQTVMILPQSSVVKNQGSPSSTPGQSPHTNYFQIQDIQRPFFSQSPLNDNASMASSSNSPQSTSSSINMTTPSTNIPMITIRSMNHVMTMNTQTLSMVMTPPLNNANVQTTPVVLTPPMNNANVHSTPIVMTSPLTSSSNASFTSILQPQGTPNINTFVMSPATTSPQNILNDNSIIFSPSISSTASPDVSSPATISSSSTSHSKLKGKETTNQEEESSSSSYYPSIPFSSDMDNSKSHTTNFTNTVPNPFQPQSLLFMTPSTTYFNTTSSPSPQQPSSSSQPSNIQDASNLASPVNVSVPIPLSLNVRNIKQRIADLTLKAEKGNSIEDHGEGMSDPTSLSQSITSTPVHSTSSVRTGEEKEEEEEKGESSSSSSPSTTLGSDSKMTNKNKFNQSTTPAFPSQSSLLMKELHQEEEAPSTSTNSQEETFKDHAATFWDDMEEEEEIFNLDEFNHEEKKAIYDIIDSSKEDLEEIQMEKDEKIRSFIEENKKDFSNLSSSPKTPPPSLASSPFFQK